LCRWKANAIADFALSLSKGGRALQARFDKLSTGLRGWAGEDRFLCSRDHCFGSTI
jgi:hypothetical protein